MLRNRKSPRVLGMSLSLTHGSLGAVSCANSLSGASWPMTLPLLHGIRCDAVEVWTRTDPEAILAIRVGEPCSCRCQRRQLADRSSARQPERRRSESQAVRSDAGPAASRDHSGANLQAGARWRPTSTSARRMSPRRGRVSRLLSQSVQPCIRRSPGLLRPRRLSDAGFSCRRGVNRRSDCWRPTRPGHAQAA